MRRIIKKLTAAAALAVMLVMGAVGYLDWALPDDYYTSAPEAFGLPQYQLLTVEREGGAEAVRTALNPVKDEQVTLMLGGVVPVKTVSLHQTEKRYLVPCGTPFG